MDLFKRGMQAFLQRPFSQWPFESSNERKVQKCSEPELYVSNGQDEYTSKSQSTFVIINEDGRRCPAILLTREDSEEIKELLQHAREQLVKQKQAEAEVAARQTLRERLLLQLRSLETRQAQAIYHRCLEAEAEARDQKQVLLEDLERLDLLDQACGASQHKHESGHSEAYTEPPFDVELLEALEAEDGQNENDEPCIEADDDGDEHSEVSVEEGEALDFPAMLEQVETDLNAISVLREEIALKEEDIGTRRSALDNAVVRLEAAGYDCNTGDESRHLEDVIDELMGFLSILRAEEAESGESLHIDDCESQLSDCVARLEERGLLNAAETMQKYGSLRLGLGIIGVDCEGAIAQGDKAQLQDSCLQAMLNAYGDVLYEKKKIQDLKRDMPNAMTEYRRKGYLEVITEHEAALAQHEVEYQEARLRMEEVGLCPPPADKMPALEVENSTAGSIDIADFLAAQQRDDDEGPDANVNKISSLPGLIDVPKEAQLTRWRYSLGAFDEETQWDMPASASDDGCWDDLPSMCGDDSLSVRGGFVSEMSDQRKLAVWRAEEDKARLAVARLRDEMYDGLAALFED